MTREEYIEFANALKNNYTIDFDKLPEFCDMTISALSAPSANVISIDQANAMIKSYVSHYEENKGEWIPVSERLPKDEEDVLTYSNYGGMKIAYYHIDYTKYSIGFKDLNETGWYDENDDAMYPEPIAWMPLPEPYKAEKGGE